MIRLATEPAGDVAPIVLIALLIGGATIFGFGYAFAAMVRANADYKEAKASLPGKRRDYWSAWWVSVKRGSVLFIAFVILVVLVMTEARRG